MCDNTEAHDCSIGRQIKKLQIKSILDSSTCIESARFQSNVYWFPYNMERGRYNTILTCCYLTYECIWSIDRTHNFDGNNSSAPCKVHMCKFGSMFVHPHEAEHQQPLTNWSFIPRTRTTRSILPLANLAISWHDICQPSPEVARQRLAFLTPFGYIYGLVLVWYG